MIRRPPSPIVLRRYMNSDINLVRERQVTYEYERRIESYISEAQRQIRRLYRRENEIDREIEIVTRLSRLI